MSIGHPAPPTAFTAEANQPHPCRSPARPKRAHSLPDSRRRQELSSFAQAHILRPQFCGGVRCALEDGQDGPATRNRRGLDVVPDAETFPGTLGSPVMRIDSVER